MSAAEKCRLYARLFAELDPAGQCDCLLELGLAAPQPPARLLTEENRIAGCRTDGWAAAACRNGRVEAWLHSDSALVRGAMQIFREIYAGCTPGEIRAVPPAWLDAVSDQVLYPEIKQNGLWKCYLRMAFLEHTENTKERIKPL